METRITKEVGRLRRLLVDLERLEAGTVSAPALMATPVLDQWSAARRNVHCLQGIVEGHPSLPDGHEIITSELYAHFHADDEHFVRTLNRWYRLGTHRTGTRS
ncbi:hypothetical protein [Rhizobium sp. LjRoot258]|uniref:hypothetical protein n=1 Tax=Rhizobium sp. LjRoot258 TaxID=3342299 RepID=UPI003ECF1C9A